MSKELDTAIGAVSKIGNLEVVKAEHTPTPWTIGEFQENSFINQRPINPAIGAVYGDENQTLVNAAFIVRAVNAHDALVEALLLHDRAATELHGKKYIGSDTHRKTKAALKLARGEE